MSTNMSEQDVFIAADEALVRIVDQIKDDQWDIEAPAEMSWQGPAKVRALINYHAYDDICVPETLAGKQIDELTHQREDDFLADDPKAAFRQIADDAIKAVRALTDEDLDRPVHLSYGDFPIREYLKHITSYRGLRAVDFARLIGVDDTLPADLVQGMWDEFSPEADAWRKMGVFGPEVKVAEDAPLQQRLLGMTGRQPKK